MGRVLLRRVPWKRVANFTQAAEIGARFLGIIEIGRDTHQAF